MKFLSTLWALAFPGTPGAARTPEDGKHSIRHVAIIGAGAAGASTAYHLRKFAEQDGVAVNVTIFEARADVGGRARVVHVFDNPAEPFELGASIFIEANHILWNASRDFNLTRRDPDFNEDGMLAVWDGDRFKFQQSYQSWNWWNLAKLFWKYGLAPYRTQKLVDQMVATFLNLYKEPHFPFRSLTTAAFDLDLTSLTGQTGEQFLSENKISPLYALDIVQSSTRVNYASNLAYIHALDTMVAMAPSGASQIVGGNWQIFDEMIKASGARLRLNTSVASIALTSSKPVGYELKSKSASSLSDDVEESTQFDQVVLATPYQFSGIKVGDDVFQNVVDEIPYVKLHVTLFTSPFTLHAEFFKLPPASETPTLVLTTLNGDVVTGDPGAGKAGFFSISTHKIVTNPATGLPERLYKIFSAEKITPAFLSELLGVPVPGTFTGLPDGHPEMVEPVSWIHTHVFHSYPKAFPRVTFQDPILGDGLYYTSGMESFISTMETNALMGMNVARLIVNDLAGKQIGAPIEAEGSQKPLGGEEWETPSAKEL